MGAKAMLSLAMVLTVLAHSPCAGALNPSDFDRNGHVDFGDFAFLASAWLTHTGGPNWNPVCDISEPKDGVIDNLDLHVLSLNWLDYPCAGAFNPSDLDTDGYVDFGDFAFLASAWLTHTGGPNWNPVCDISEPKDGVINNLDLFILSLNWLDDNMALIPAGEIEMGAHFNEKISDELPVHAVYVDSFYISRHEITNQQYCDYLNSEHSSNQIKLVSGVVYDSTDSNNTRPYCDMHSSDPDSQIDYANSVFSVISKAGHKMSNFPMVQVSWYGAVAYCNWRSSQDGLEMCYNTKEASDPNWPCDFSKQGYRLPTEAEWEYAARGCRRDLYSRFPWGDKISHSQANYYSHRLYDFYPYDVSPTRGYHPKYKSGVFPHTAQVGSFQADGYGLFDMAGNVWEWTNDRYNRNYYSSSPYHNPTGSASGSRRVLRGGGCSSYASMCRVAFRLNSSRSSRNYIIGFRVVLDLN
jgi:formylglycine-generating enzyme required for sulfatase activity